MKTSKSRKPGGLPKAFPKRVKPLAPPPAMLPSEAPPVGAPLDSAPMFKRGGAVSDMDMDDSPKARKRADRKSGKGCC